MNTYERINQMLVNELNNGHTPWRKTWSDPSAALTSCVSHSNGKGYSLLNQILLYMQGKTAGEYITFNQAKKETNDEPGKGVKKGAKGAYICFYTIVEKESDERDEEGNPIIKRYPILKGYSVFNAATDCEGIKLKYAKPADSGAQDSTPADADETAEKIITQYVNRSGLTLKIKSAFNAFYELNADKVTCPRRDQFESVEEYYSTLFHELCHSTGHADRLNRKAMQDKAASGTQTYSQEELVAEIGAAYLCGICGIDTATLENSAAYLRGWAKFLNDNPRAFATAAAQAEKAVDYILTGEK